VRQARHVRHLHETAPAANCGFPPPLTSFGVVVPVVVRDERRRHHDRVTWLQADGLGCVVCKADFLRVRVPHVPVGRSVSGSQVFAYVSCRLPDTQYAGGAAR